MVHPCYEPSYETQVETPTPFVIEALAKWSVDGAAPLLKKASNHHFHYAPRFATSTLAPVSDSLVRVSRRDKEHHFLKTLTPPKAQAFLRVMVTLSKQINAQRHTQVGEPNMHSAHTLMTFGSLSAISGTL